MNSRVVVLGVIALVLAVGGTLLSAFYHQALLGIGMIALAWVLSMNMKKLNFSAKK